MPLTTEHSGAALVGRPLYAEGVMKVRKVKVLRPFYFNRQVQPVGQLVELPALFALECASAKKVELVDEVPAVPEKSSAAADVTDESKGSTRKK